MRTKSQQIALTRELEASQMWFDGNFAGAIVAFIEASRLARESDSIVANEWADRLLGQSSKVADLYDAGFGR